MIRRLIILDSALILLLAFGVVRLREEWQAFGPAHQVSSVQAKVESLPSLPAGAAAAPASADWTEIPTNNPFSFDRNDIAILAPPPPTAIPVGPKPILFGTMLLGQGWTAMLASGQTQNRNSRAFRVGESIDGWTIVEIDEKSVVVESNSIRQTLSTEDWVTMQIARGTERTQGAAAPSPVIQSVGPPAASPPPSTASSSSGSSTTSGVRPTTERMCEMQTPFGKVTRPCEDSGR